MECSKKRELDLMAAKIRKTALQTIQAAGSVVCSPSRGQ